jgi:hypothetical protein
LRDSWVRGFSKTAEGINKTLLGKDISSMGKLIGEWVPDELQSLDLPCFTQ